MKLNKKTQRLLLIGLVAGVVVYYFYNKSKKSAPNDPLKAAIDLSKDNGAIIAPEPEPTQPTPTQATTQPSTTTAIVATQTASNTPSGVLVPTNNSNTTTVIQVQPPVMSSVPLLPSNFNAY